jgi:hypothetical protein
VSFEEDIEEEEDSFALGNKQLLEDKNETLKVNRKVTAKQNVTVSTYMSTSSKFKSKYSNIPSKTESNLKKKGF